MGDTGEPNIIAAPTPVTDFEFRIIGPPPAPPPIPAGIARVWIEIPKAPLLRPRARSRSPSPIAFTMASTSTPEDDEEQKIGECGK